MSCGAPSLSGSRLEACEGCLEKEVVQTSAGMIARAADQNTLTCDAARAISPPFRASIPDPYIFRAASLLPPYLSFRKILAILIVFPRPSSYISPQCLRHHHHHPSLDHCPRCCQRHFYIPPARLPHAYPCCRAASSFAIRGHRRWLRHHLPRKNTLRL